MKVALIFIFLASLFPLSHANGSCGSSNTALYFANGMFNDRIGAYESLIYLWGSFTKRYPQDKLSKVQTAFNANEPVLRQLYQVYRQKEVESSLNFWRSIAKMVSKMDSLEYLQLDGLITDQEVKFDADLREQIKSYKDSINEGFSIVTVAHSQGNLYTNFAFSRVDSILTNMISVATPASYVSGEGPYFTFKSDGVIKYVIGALPPNIVRQLAGLFDHEFVNHYLKDLPTQEKVTDAIHDAIHNQVYSGWNTLKAIDGYFNSDMSKGLKWFKGISQEKRRLSSGECITAESIFKVFSLDGRECEDRDYKTFSEVIRDCAIDPGDGGSTSCPYYGGLAYDADKLGRWPDEAVSFYKEHEECDMTRQDFVKVRDQGSAEAIKILRTLMQ